MSKDDEGVQASVPAPRAVRLVVVCEDDHPPEIKNVVVVGDPSPDAAVAFARRVAKTLIDIERLKQQWKRQDAEESGCSGHPLQSS